MTQLLTRCQIPRALHGDFWEALQLVRSRATNGESHAQPGTTDR
jgi:hypothetical protein